ncbi:MAG TPA: substrate-binding domain-containing protein [Saprospiraceae bacterium]|nr:substrate-binding domain-containing protein [Saprospiraceae bacterium]
MKYTFQFFSVLLIAFTSCQQPKDKSGKPIDTPTTGEITIMVDEGYRPIIESSIDVFDSIYRLAKINAFYVAEGEAVSALMKDSVDVIVITRQLTADEMKFFESRGFKPRITPIAYDALAFILHPSNRDTVFTKAQIHDLLTGKIAKWSELNPKSPLSDVRLVFDHPLSGTVRYVKDSIIAGTPLTPNATALKTNEEVIDYVAKNKNAVGIISANWISDTDDGGVQKFLREIKIADIADTTGAEGYGPYQAYLAKNWYPYKRTVYIINAQARNGLGVGFASYLAADGQRIVLKDGLLPANAVTRLIKVTR